MSPPINAEHYAAELRNAPANNQSYESVAQAEVRQIRLDYGSKPGEYLSALQAVENKLGGQALQAFGFAASRDLLQQDPANLASLMLPGYQQQFGQYASSIGPRNVDNDNVIETYQDGSSRGYHFERDANTGVRIATAVNETDKNGISRKLIRMPNGTWAAGQTSDAYGAAIEPGDLGTSIVSVDAPPNLGAGVSVGSTLSGQNTGRGELALTPRDETTPQNPHRQTFADTPPDDGPTPG